jgi:hypothetical protein
VCRRRVITGWLHLRALRSRARSRRADKRPEREALAHARTPLLPLHDSDSDDSFDSAESAVRCPSPPVSEGSCVLRQLMVVPPNTAVPGLGAPSWDVRFCRYRFPATDLNSKATWFGIQ